MADEVVVVDDDDEAAEHELRTLSFLDCVNQIIENLERPDSPEPDADREPMVAVHVSEFLYVCGFAPTHDPTAINIFLDIEVEGEPQFDYILPRRWVKHIVRVACENRARLLQEEIAELLAIPAKLK